MGVETGFCHGGRKFVVSRAIRFIRECPLRELNVLYESANDSLNEK